MAQNIHTDRVEVFSFASTGPVQALEEAARVIRENPGKFEEEELTLVVDDDGSYVITLPYRVAEDTGPLYPEIEVELTGTDSHPFSIIFEVTKALKAAKVPLAKCTEFREEALSGDYNHVIQTAMRWVTVF